MAAGASLVEDHRGPDGKVISELGRSGRVLMFGQQLVQRVGSQTALGGQHFRCRRGGRHPKRRASLCLKVTHGGSECGGLAGTGRTDNQLQSPVAG